jgi:hypothetical protein
MYWESVRAVVAYMKRLSCDAFDNKLILIDWFRRYIAQQPNITLFEDEKLPLGMEAVTLKRRVQVLGVTRSMFLILVAPIDDAIRKQCVLLHGRVMHEGMLFRQHDRPMSSSLETSLEVEANVYALMSLIPTSIITVTARHGALTPQALQDVASRLYGYPVELPLIQERLLIHGVLNHDPTQSAKPLEDEFRKLILGPDCRSSIGRRTERPKWEDVTGHIPLDAYYAIRSELGEVIPDCSDEAWEDIVWGPPVLP